MDVEELIARLQALPPGTRVLMQRMLGNGEIMAVPCVVEYWYMEKVQEARGLALELWEDTSVKDFEAGKFERCVLFRW